MDTSKNKRVYALNMKPKQAFSGNGFFVLLACVFLFCFGLAGCPKKKAKGPFIPGINKIDGEVQVFTESSPVNALVASAGKLWVGTHNGLIRWNLKTGSAIHLTSDDGLPGNDVLALASDGSKGLWLATPEGIATYKDGRWTQYGDCPLGRDINTLAPSGDGSSVWVGGSGGLYRHIFGRWQKINDNVEVTTLLTSVEEGSVWVGTRGAGILKCEAGGCVSFGKSKGLDFKNVRKLSFGIRGIIAVGSSTGGDRLAHYLNGRWYSYSVKPKVLLNWVRFAMGKTFVSAGGNIYNMVSHKKDKKYKKSDLKLIGTKNAPKYKLVPVDLPLPSTVTQVSGALGYLWIGTQSLGVIRYDGESYVHYRTKDLGARARRLSVACHGPIDCYVTNGVSAFRFDGTVWSVMQHISGVLQASIQYFVKDPKGKVTAIFRNEVGHLQVATLKDGSWKVWKLKQSIEGRRPLTVTAGGFDFYGRLWLGIAEVSSRNELNGFGSVTIDPVSGEVVYHRNFQGTEGAGEDSLSLPNDVTDFVFKQKEVWVASTSGVCRVQGGHKVKCFTSSDGLSSELIRGITVGPNRKIWAVSVEGVDEFTGARFTRRSEPGLTEHRFRAITMGPKGSVWLGGISGLGQFKNGNLQVYNEDSQLLQTRVKHLCSDTRGRVWVLHPGGISLIKP